MKKLFLAGLSLLSVTAFAQKGTPVKKPVAAKPAPKPAAPANPLKTKIDSVSYAIGVQVADFYKNQQNIPNLNTAAMSKAINDIYTNKKTALTVDQSMSMLMRFFNPALDKTIGEGEAFLAANKKRPGVKTTASGLQYEVLQEGTGAKPTAQDTVVAHYKGTLINGVEFDNSYNRNTPLTIGVGQVVKGWIEGLQLMSVGGKYKLYIPYNLAYGMNDSGPIPGGSVLIFEMELLDVKKAATVDR